MRIMNNENLNTTEKVEVKEEKKHYPYVYGISFKKALQTYFFSLACRAQRRPRKR